MKNLVFATTFILLIFAGSSARAQDLESLIPGTMRVGGHFSMGIANTAGNFDDNNNATARFAGGIGFNFSYFVLPYLALDGGLGFMGKGFRQQGNTMFTEDLVIKTRITYLEIPLGAYFEYRNIQVGLYFVLNFAVSGRQSEKDGNSITRRDIPDVIWEDVRKFNLSPKIYAGYALPIKLPFGTMYAIPGFEFSFHFINDYKGPLDSTMRAINFMLRIGVAYEF